MANFIWYELLADDLAAMLDRLDVRGATLVGHSMSNGEIVRYLAVHRGRGQQGGAFRHALAAAAVDDHARSGLGEPRRKALSEPARGSRDEGCASAEVEQIRQGTPPRR